MFSIEIRALGIFVPKAVVSPKVGHASGTSPDFRGGTPMPNGTPSYELGQFGKLSSELLLAMPTALHGVDPKVALKAVKGQGEQFGRHIRKFFVPTDGTTGELLRPTMLVTIPQVPVNYDLDWNERINQAGPNTGTDWNVRKVGDLYLTERKGIVLTDITLAGFGQKVESEQVLDFGLEWQLGRTMNPHEAFTLLAHRPNLHRELGHSAMAAVSLEHCSFQGARRVCYSWWDGDGRGCDLVWFGVTWSEDCCCGFVRES